MNLIKGLIFDFDGTLADSLGVLLECVNHLADDYNYPRIDNIDSIRSKPLKEFIRSHIRLNPLYLYLWRREIRRLIRKRRYRIELFEGIEKLLLDLQNHGLFLYLLTSSPAEHCIPLLRRHGLDIFCGYYCGASMFNKARLINTLIKDSGIPKSQLCYIGDEIKDVESCVKADIHMIGVGWGMNDPQSLLAAGALQVVDTPDGIRKFVLR